MDLPSWIKQSPEERRQQLIDLFSGSPNRFDPKSGKFVKDQGNQSSKSNNKGKGTGLANIPRNENYNLAARNYDRAVTLPSVGGGNSGTFRPDTPGSSPSLELGSTERPAPPPPPTPPGAPVACTGRNISDPTGQSEAKGTQMGSRSASYEDVMAFLGPYASQFLPLNSSALPTTSPGQQQLNQPITPKTFTVGEGTYEVDGDYLEAQQDLIDQRSKYHVGNESSYVEIDGNKISIDPEAEQDLADQASQYFNTENKEFAGTADGLDQTRTVDASNKNSGINWANRSALDNSDESVRRRTAFLDAPDVLSGLKARDHLYNKYYASGQYHEKPEKGGKTEVSYDNADVRRFMNADIGSAEQQEAQNLLDSYKNRIKTGAAVAQNPMLNADEGEGKITATASSNQEADFVENNASPGDVKPAAVMTPYGGYVNGKPVDLMSRNTPRNLRYTLTPEEVDEAIKKGTLNEDVSQLRGY